jgi:hypothetical protein
LAHLLLPLFIFNGMAKAKEPNPRLLKNIFPKNLDDIIWIITFGLKLSK